MAQTTRGGSEFAAYFRDMDAYDAAANRSDAGQHGLVAGGTNRPASGFGAGQIVAVLASATVFPMLGYWLASVAWGL